MIRPATPDHPVAEATARAGPRIESLLRFGAKALNVPVLRVRIRTGAAELSFGQSPVEPDLDRHPGVERLRAQLLERGAPLAVEIVPPEPSSAGRAGEPAGLAWAGVPLRAGSGEVVGSLTAMELHRRRWLRRELEALEELADCMAQEIARSGRVEADAAFGPGPEPRTGAERGGARWREGGPRAERREILSWLRRSRCAGEIERGATGEALAAWMRDCLREGLYAGYVRAGDRLPSIREIARALGATTYAVAEAYRRLEGLGLVERRDRSGMYVAPPAPGPDPPASETAQWIVEVLEQAVEHRLKILQLPDLIRRWTVGQGLRCACLESSEDARVALCSELTEIYGLEAEPVPLDALPTRGERGALSPGEVPERVREADILVTTTYHGAVLHPVAETLGRPLVASTVHPDIISAIERHLEERSELALICVDPAFGERFRSGIRGGLYRDRIRMVLADDPAALAALDRSEPVYLTRAARKRLGSRADFRLVARPSPTFSPDFARSLLRVVADLHLRAPAAP